MSDLDQNSKVGTSTDELSQRRRALLKGSAVAVPAILTLRSGSALAAGSLTCIDKIPNGDPPVAAVDKVDSDNWFRTNTTCRKLQQNSTTLLKFVYQDPGNLNNWYEESTISTLGRVLYKNVDGSSNEMVDDAAPTPHTYLIELDNQPCYVLIQVGSDGKPTGLYGASDPGTFPFASNSCETSLINRP